MARQIPPKSLDKFRFSPVGKTAQDRAEFKAAFDLAHGLYPGVDLTYIGTDGRQHYFQERGVTEAYVVPLQLTRPSL